MMSEPSLDERFGDVAGILNVAHGQLVSLTVELLESRGWEGWGIHSPEAWLAWRCGLSPALAHDVVRIARRVAELPLTFAKFAAGELALGQVAVVAKYAPTWNDAEACEFATYATVAQLRKGLSKWPFPKTVAEPEASESEPAPDPKPEPKPEPKPPAEFVNIRFDDDGMLALSGLLSAENGAIVEKALQEARDALFRAGNKQVSWADALTEVCSRSLATVKSPSRVDRYRVYVHLDTEGGWLNGEQRLPQHLVDLMTCDGVVKPVWETGGKPVNIGRATRIVPNDLRRLIEDRDRVCRHPMCNNTHNLQIHHVQHWTRGGPTDTANLAGLCGSKCHPALHRGEFTMEGNADEPNGLVFKNRWGAPIVGAGAPVPPSCPLPGPVNGHRYQHPTGEPLQTKWLQFSDPPATAA